MRRDTVKRVGIVGLGYVGLPLAIAFAEAGFEVVGVDNDAGKVAAINAGESHVEYVPPEDLKPLTQAGRLRAARGVRVGRRRLRKRPNSPLPASVDVL